MSTTSDGSLYRFDAMRTTGPIRLLTGPSNTGSPLGVVVLLIQAIVLGLTALLALPTSRITQRFRPLPQLRAAKVDTRTVEPRAEPVVLRTPEQAMARELQTVGTGQVEVGSWR